MLPFEIVMEITKPVGLALRLFGNILAGTSRVARDAVPRTAVGHPLSWNRPAQRGARA